MEIAEEEFRIIPIEPFPRGGLELHKKVIEVGKKMGVNVAKPLQANSVSEQEKFFGEYIEPYKNQIESQTSTRLDDTFYRTGEINLRGFILFEAENAMIYGSPYFWYLEPFNPPTLTTFLEALEVAIVMETGKAIVKAGKQKAPNFFKRLSESLRVIKPSLVITSHGTIEEERLTAEEKYALSNFAEKDNITFITGWDFKDKSKKLINTILKPNNLIMEGGTVLYQKGNGWIEKRLFNQDERMLAKKAWYAMLECMPQFLSEAIFMSQADEYSICVYINPPNNVVNDLEENRRSEISSGSEFANKLREKGIESIEIGDETIKIAKNIENAYIAEKINASYRTFKPYKIELEDDFILITLLQDDYKYNPINMQVRDGVKIVPDILNKITNCVKNKVPIKNRFAPQTDVCVDIFVKSKEEIMESDVLDNIGLSRSKEVIYISKSTRSDIPFIEQLSIVCNKRGVNFKAFGDATVPTELQSVGVKRISEAEDTVSLINRLAEIRSRTDWEFFIG